MSEQDRRQEILKAEEIIRQLASEMASASEAAEQARSASQELRAASATVTEAKTELDRTSVAFASSGTKLLEAVISASNKGVETLSAASEGIGKIGEQITAATDRFQSTAQSLEGNSREQLSRLDKLSTSVSEGFQSVIKAIGNSDSQLARLTSLVRWALILSSVAAVCSMISIIFLLTRVYINFNSKFTVNGKGAGNRKSTSTNS